MKRKNLFIKILATAVIVSAILCLTAVVYGVNTSSDPLVTLSYLTGSYKAGILSDVNTAVAAESRQLSTEFSQQVSDLKAALPSLSPAAAENDFRTVDLAAGQTVSVSAGGEVLMLSGSAAASDAGLTDTTAGSSVSAGGALTANHLYVAAADCTIRASGSAKLLVK